ncbi:MAG: hypothetical protein KAH38_08055 [Candidatus Hydrogenedentes bacterium]|nr:hypothetical protein [Candidatus Hydrogenedentota bacterium]
MASGSGPRKWVDFTDEGDYIVIAETPSISRAANIKCFDVPSPGQKLWISINTPFHPFLLFNVDSTRDASQDWGREAILGGGWLNGRTNACVHAYWCALMALKIGGDLAEGASTAHEYSGVDVYMKCATAMDMYNNNEAIESAISELDGMDTIYGWQVRNMIINKLNAGELMMMTNQINEETLGLMIPTDSVALENTPTNLEPPYWRHPSLSSEKIR